MTDAQLRDVQATAVALLRPGDEFAFATRHCGDEVLVAIARPQGSQVLTMSAEEYGMGLELAALLGFPPAAPKPAIERVRKVRNAQGQ